MESYLKSPQPEVIPRPTTVPKPKTAPQVDPDENDPFSVPGPLINPTPKGFRKIKKVFKFCNIYIL
jgi:hypothetical protein